jgi:hypothetical protein
MGAKWMEAVDAKKMTSQDEISKISQLIGDYRAEWLKDKVFEFFSVPKYLTELQNARPCVLVGDRGTGKTTVLRGLSYEGQYALQGEDLEAIEHIGVYFLIKRSQTYAFQGPELSEDKWTRIFGHYINLAVCELFLEFIDWYNVRTEVQIVLPTNVTSDLLASLGLPESSAPIQNILRRERIEFEAYINNAADAPYPRLSMLGSPIEILLEGFGMLQPFQGKSFSILVDEYEALLDYQQRVFNTLIKQSGGYYSLKIGVRNLGWRCKETLSQGELLKSPEDYALIEINQKLKGADYKKFAASVVTQRLHDVTKINIESDPSQLLPGISEDDEAELLGVSAKASAIRRELEQQLDSSKLDKINFTPLQLYFLDFWAKAKHQSLADSYEEAVVNEKQWFVRYNNYKHAILYTLRGGKAGIRKYYCGWDTLVLMSAGNIRYLLQLVSQCIGLHLSENKSLETPIAFSTQTVAAQNVGKANLFELEGLSTNGAQLTRLLLGLGRVFQLMAANPEGHAPEVNEFELEGASSLRLVETLRESIMHIALVRIPGTKPTGAGDTKDWQYMLHPIFSAFFVFSPRRKRKMQILTDDFIGLIDDPRKFVPKVLESQRRLNLVDDILPEQLELFGGYYGGD